MTRKTSLLFILFVLWFATACATTTSSRPSPLPASAASSTPVISPMVYTETPAPPSTPEGTGQATFIITGTVMGVALSAQVIFLEQPVHGISEIALTDQTTIVFEGDGVATLRAITPGTQIRVMGGIGSPGALIATQIVLLGQ